jgi:hypothetical protein
MPPAKASQQLTTDPAMDPASRYRDELWGNLRCFDGVIIQGTLIGVAHPGTLLVSMYAAGSKPRDLARFGQPITFQVRDHIIGLPRRHGIEIEMVPQLPRRPSKIEATLVRFNKAEAKQIKNSKRQWPKQPIDHGF